MEGFAKKKRTLRKTPHYKQNPFQQGQQSHVLTVFRPSEYILTTMGLLTPPALRLLVYMVAKMEPDGSVRCPLSEAKRIFPHPTSTLSVGMGELIKHDWIRRRTLSEYWLNPSIAFPIQIAR